MCDDPVDVLFCVAAVVVGLQEDDMCACFAGEVGANLRFVCFLFEHGYRNQQTSQGLDGHCIGHENIRTSFVATFVEVLLNGAFIVRTLNQFDIFVIIPDHRIQMSEFRCQNSDVSFLIVVFDPYMI